jgi:hypothetical protein
MYKVLGLIPEPKKEEIKRTGGVAQKGENMSSKLKALSSNPSATKRN